jgi:hypothetical protein
MSNLTRFGMTDPPDVGGQPGDYEERWAQWFLEQSFFRDFIYRNPRGKRKGTELADALVLFDDVVRSETGVVAAGASRRSARAL